MNFNDPLFKNLTGALADGEYFLKKFTSVSEWHDINDPRLDEERTKMLESQIIINSCLDKLKNGEGDFSEEERTIYIPMLEHLLKINDKIIDLIDQGIALRQVL